MTTLLNARVVDVREGTIREEWVAVPENYVLRLPPSMSFGHAAAFTHVFLTTFHALD